MPKRIRHIPRTPARKNYFLVDACFLANRYLPLAGVKEHAERRAIEASRKWWEEIDRQIKQTKAMVFVLDLCIAESFKVLAKKKYQEGLFRYDEDYKRARDRLSSDVRLSSREARKTSRVIRWHDLQTNRDIIISVDRFFEPFLKKKIQVSVVDLLILATGKYLIDFYGFSRKDLFVVSLDRNLWRGARTIRDIPLVFCPTERVDEFSKVFR